MKIVKLSTPWHHNFYNQTPNGDGIIGNYKFEIDNDCVECDYWIVWGNLKTKSKVKCNPLHTIYITDEAHEERVFNQEFLNQFNTIISQRADIEHVNIIKTHDLGIWHFPLNYEEVVSLTPPEKSKNISAISSDLTWLDGHKKRFAFINKLMGHYKNNMDFYGRGINPIDNKFDGLKSYRFSIAIENSFLNDYFTEKLFECFLSYTFPIYYGCPNLDQYFDERSFLRIDLDDFETALNIIDQAANPNFYKDRLPYLMEAREQYLNEYHVFKRLINILSTYQQDSKVRKSVSLRPEGEFNLGFREKIKSLIK